jgi:broad specificity phosphatase PhoE
MGMHLTVVRHGETGWNRERRYQGATDTPLSDTGRAQAEAAGQALAAEALAAVWSSPLQRARETAEAIARPQKLTVQIHPGFSEMGFGVWEGLTGDEVRERFPDDYRRWREDPEAATWAGAESLRAVQTRTLAGLAELRARHDGQRVCLVTHGIVARILILQALGLPLDRLWSVHVSFSGVSELEFRDDWTAVHRMNTLVHLDGAPASVRGIAG